MNITKYKGGVNRFLKNFERILEGKMGGGARMQDSGFKHLAPVCRANTDRGLVEVEGRETRVEGGKQRENHAYVNLLQLKRIAKPGAKIALSPVL